MTPALIEPYSPNGLPTTNTSSPIRTRARVAERRRDEQSPAGCLRCSDRDVVLGLRCVTIGRRLVPSANVSLIVVASATTWRLVRMSPGHR